MTTREERAAAGRLAEHFEDLTRQEHAVRLGMWVFLGSELLLFAGLFGLYVAYRSEYPEIFANAYRHNNLAIGSTNTAILIISSFTVAWGIHELRKGRRRMCMGSLTITVLLGLVFLTLKGIEWSQHFRQGIFPGAYYSFPELPSRGANVFFTLYYFMTGLHALHVIGGVCVISWLILRVRSRRATQAYHPEVELGGLYWHLVDAIWIFLWPLFYLAG